MKGNKASLGQWYSPVEETGQVNAEPMETSEMTADSAWVQTGGETAKKDTADSPFKGTGNSDLAWIKENDKNNRQDRISVKENRDNVIPLDTSAKSGNQSLLEFAHATWDGDSSDTNSVVDKRDNNSLPGSGFDQSGAVGGAVENNVFVNSDSGAGVGNADDPADEKESGPEVNSGEDHIKTALASRKLYLEKEIAELVVSIRKDIEVKQTFTEELDRINHNLAALLHKERQKKKLMNMITVILALLLFVSVGFSLTFFFKAQKQILEKDLTILELQSGASSGIINGSSSNTGGIL